MSLDGNIADKSSALWRPSAKLTSKLLLGALGALGSAAGFAVVTVMSLLGNFPDQPLHLTWWLDLASSSLLLLPMLAYHALGNEIESAGLKKTSACLALAAIIPPILELADPEVVPAGWPGVFLGIGGLGIVVMVLLGFLYPRSPTPSKSAAETSEGDWSGQARGAGVGVGGGTLFLTFLGLKALARGLFRQGNLWDLEVVMFGAWGILLLLSLIFVVWFGAVKLRHWDKLGALAGALGTYEIVGAVLAACAIGLMLMALVNVEQPGMNEQQVEQAMNELGESWARAGLVIQTIAMACWAILTALLFTVLRNRYEPESTLEPLAG